MSSLLAILVLTLIAVSVRDSESSLIKRVHCRARKGGLVFEVQTKVGKTEKVYFVKVGDCPVTTKTSLPSRSVNFDIKVDDSQLACGITKKSSRYSAVVTLNKHPVIERPGNYYRFRVDCPPRNNGVLATAVKTVSFVVANVPDMTDPKMMKADVDCTSNGNRNEFHVNATVKGSYLPFKLVVGWHKGHTGCRATPVTKPSTSLSFTIGFNKNDKKLPCGIAKVKANTYELYTQLPTHSVIMRLYPYNYYYTIRAVCTFD